MDFLGYFTTATGLVTLIDTITEFLKVKLKIPNTYIQYVSWLIGILLSVVGQLLDLGMFATLTWIPTILVGFVAALASNGVFDTGIVDWIISKFKPKTE